MLLLLLLPGTIPRQIQVANGKKEATTFLYYLLPGIE